MPLRQRYLRLMLRIVPAGAVGASLLLGSTVPSTASSRASDMQPSVSKEARVSERLAAIRQAVSALIESDSRARLPDRNLQLAWGNRWGNWGWGRRHRWGRGRPWNNWWRNW